MVLFSLAGLVLNRFSISIRDLFIKSDNLTTSLLFCMGAVLLVIIVEWSSMQAILKRRVLSEQPEFEFAGRVRFARDGTLNAVLISLFCCLSAMWEELLFRGIFREAVELTSIPIYVYFLASPLLFALYHFYSGLGQMIYSFFFGVFYVVIFQISDSLLVPVATHAAGNLFTLLVTIPRITRKKEIVWF